MRLIPLLLLLAVLGTGLALWLGGLAPALSWAGIGAHLRDWREDAGTAPLATALVYVAAYASVVAVSLPAGGALTVLGGAMFGPFLGASLAVVAASLGAVLLFLLARGALGSVLRRRAGPLAERLRPMLARDGFGGLLAMRLIPVVPFWLSNLAPALLGMRLAPFVAATVLGIAPASFVLAGIGAGAAGILAEGRAPDLSRLLAPPVLLPLLGLAALSLAPSAWRRWRARDA